MSVHSMLFRIAILAAAVILLSASPKPLLAASGSISVSAGLTDYLHSHRLPAVGAKITTAENGVRTVMLYGFVATERGYHDAELRTRHYLHDAKLQIVNRIRVEPVLLQPANAGSSSNQAADYEKSRSEAARLGISPGSPAPNPAPPPDVGSVQDYQTQQNDELSFMQQHGTATGGAMMLAPLIGGLAGYGALGGFSAPPPVYTYRPPPIFYRPPAYTPPYRPPVYVPPPRPIFPRFRAPHFGRRR